MTLKVSIVVPNHLGAIGCAPVLEALFVQTVRPIQIVVISSGFRDADDSYIAEFVARFEVIGVRLSFYQEEHLYPGESRNRGLEIATEAWIGLLDIETIPQADWLERQLQLITTNDAQGSFGSTVYLACGLVQNLIRDAIYGRKPIFTIPGSVLSKNTFDKVGRFIPMIRAAEDTEWIIRARLMGIKILQCSGSGHITYHGLSRFGFLGMLRKWYRNYSSARKLQHLRLQYLVISLVIYFFGSLVAFNWNSLVAGWEVESPFYFDHITKIVSLSPIAIYVFFRGFYIPFSRGVPLKDLIPLRFLLLASVGGFLDMVKITAFLLPGVKRPNSVRQVLGKGTSRINL